MTYIIAAAGIFAAIVVIFSLWPIISLIVLTSIGAFYLNNTFDIFEAIYGIVWAVGIWFVARMIIIHTFAQSAFDVHVEGTGLSLLFTSFFNT